jgi:recombination protein RecA
MRKLVPPVAKTKTAAIFINQWRDDASGRGAGKTMPAGKGLKFASSLTLDFSRKETLYKTKGDKAPSGQISLVKVLKSKVSLPFEKREIELKYPTRDEEGKIIKGSGGLNVMAAIIDAALDSGKLTQKGAYYYVDGENVSQGRDNLIALLQKDPELLRSIG